METLRYDFPACGTQAVDETPIVVGVVGSGNLEVMIEPVSNSNACTVEIVTAAVGFGTIWQAVIQDFITRRQPVGVRISINDVGATPAVVSLRLDQAWDCYTEKGQA